MSNPSLFIAKQIGFELRRTVYCLFHIYPSLNRKEREKKMRQATYHSGMPLDYLSSLSGQSNSCVIVLRLTDVAIPFKFVLPCMCSMIYNANKYVVAHLSARREGRKMMGSNSISSFSQYSPFFIYISSQVVGESNCSCLSHEWMMNI